MIPKSRLLIKGKYFHRHNVNPYNTKKEAKAIVKNLKEKWSPRFYQIIARVSTGQRYRHIKRMDYYIYTRKR
jgi:hypothetical protein